MNADQVRTMLRRACTEAGSAARWAYNNNVSAPYVSDVLNGNRDPGPAICRALGIEEIEPQYRKVKS